MSDVINWPFAIDSESVSDAAGVQVSVQVTPANFAQYFVVDTANSVLGPVSIARGNSQIFTIKYTIASGAPDGASFNVVLFATMTTAGALPTVGNIDDAGNILSTPTSFTIGQPSVSILAASASEGNFYDSDPFDWPTSGASVELSVSDLIQGTTSFAVGISSIQIYSGKTTNPGALIGANNQFFDQTHVYTSADAGLGVLAQLPQGYVSIVATDREGLQSQAELFVDSGFFEVEDLNENDIPDGSTTSATSVLVAGVRETASITLTGGPSEFDPVIFASTEPPVAEYDGLDSGTYVASAFDANGVLLSSSTLTVGQVTPPRMVLTWASHAGFVIADSSPSFGGFPITNPTLGTQIQAAVQPFAAGVGAAGLQVYAGNADIGNLIGSNSGSFPGPHVYSSTDAGLGVLAQLPIGPITFVGIDSLGGQTKTLVDVTTTALIVSAMGQETLAPDQFTGAQRIDVFGIPGTSSITLSGAAGDFTVALTTVPDFVQAEFNGVPEGAYAASLLDATGILIASQTFSVDLTPPTVVMTSSDTGEVIADDGFSNSRTVIIEADDFGAGMGTITVEGFDPVSFSTGPPIVGMTVSSGVAIFEDLDDGIYTVNAQDAVGNVTLTTFTVETGPSLSVSGGGTSLYDDWRSSVPPSVIPSDVLWGAQFTGVPETLPTPQAFPTEIDFSASDPAGLASLSAGGFPFQITAINGQQPSQPIDPANLPPGTTEFAGAMQISAAGSYVVTVTRPDGVQTVAPFDIVLMTALKDKDNTYALYDNKTKAFLQGQLALQLNASAGIASVSADHNDNAATLPVTQANGDYNVALSSKEFNSPLGLRVFFDDTRGNSWSYRGSFNPGVFVSSSDYTLDPFGPQLNNFVAISSYPGTPDLPWEAGSFNTPTYDLYDSSGLPGAALVQEQLAGGTSPSQILLGGATIYAENASARLALSTITVGRITVTLNTGGGVLAPAANGQTVYDGNVYYSTFSIPGSSSGTVSMDPGIVEALELARTWSLSITIVNKALDVIPMNLCQTPDTTTMMCLRGTILQTVAAPGNTTLAGPTISPVALWASSPGPARIHAMPFSATQSGFVKTLFPAGMVDGSLDLGGGITVSNVNTAVAGQFESGIGFQEPDPGYRAVPLNQAFDVQVAPGYLTSTFTVTLDFDGSGLTPAQQQQTRLVQIVNGLMSDDLPFTANGPNEITFQTSLGGRFMLLTPLFADPVKTTLGNMTLVYSQSAVNGAITAQAADPSQDPLKSLLAQALAVGEAPIGSVTELLPENTRLNPQGILRMSIDATQRAAQGMAQSPLLLTELSAGAQPSALGNAFFAYNDQVSARLSGIHSYFGVFGSTTPRFVDTLPPVTSVSFGSPISFDASGDVQLSTASPIKLSAVDPQDGNIPPSGVATTYFLVDQVFQNFQATPPQVYSSTFSLAVGTHTLVFFSEDHAGNFEAPKSTAVAVLPMTSGGGSGGPTGGGSGPQRGLAISADANGKLWEVGSDGGALWLGRYGPAGLEARAALPGALADGAWTVRFDRSGNAYAIGSATSTTEDLAVYAVSPAGVLVSSAGFHAANGAQATAWDASGELWITGVLQQGSSAGSPTLTMGLWKFTPGSGLLSLTTTYTRGGPADAGFGVRSLDGNVFVEGYSSTQSLTSPSVDLALWKFDAQGHGPVAGPFLEPGYLRSLSAPPIARLETTSGTLYAAAMRSNDAGLTDLGFVRYDANGGVMSDHFVTANGFSLTPKAIALDAQGNLAVAVSASGSQGTSYGVARFAKDGGLASFQANGESTAAVYGMAALGNDLWLALDGSTAPVRFVGDFAVPASDVMVSSGPIDTGDPATQLTAGGVAVSSGSTLAAGTTFTLTAADPPDDSGIASGVAETLYWVDVDPFACDADYDPTQPAGTCANPVYNAPFALAVGTHTVSFQSTDAAGNTEDMQVIPLTIGPADTTPPALALVPVGGSTVTTAVPILSASFSDAGSGVNLASVRLQLDGADVSTSAVVTASSATVVPASALSQGAHTFAASVADNAGNVSSSTAAFYVDSLPPTTALLVGVPQSVSDALYIATTTPLGFSPSRPAQTFYAVDGGTFAVFSASFTLATGGAHAVSYYSVDPAGIAEALRVSTVTVDVLPPSLSLTPAAGAELDVATPTITVSFSDAGAGVSTATVRLTLDGVDVTTSSVVTASSATLVPPYALSQGSHVVVAAAADAVGNAASATTQFVVDTLPAVTTLVAGTPRFGASPLFISSATLLGFATSQPARVSYSVDGSSFTVFAASFALTAPGRHALRYYSVDAAGNVEPVRSSTVAVDALPPQTQFLADGPTFSSGTLYASDVSTFGLTAEDDMAVFGDQAGSGVSQTFIAVDTTAFSAYAGAFSLDSEGAHAISFYSVDQLGRAEAARAAQVSIDATPPVSQLQLVGASTTDARGNVAVSTAALFSLSAEDPVSGGVASGLNAIYYAVDPDPVSPSYVEYGSPFSLPPGRHTLAFFAEDNVGNQEDDHVSSFTVDGLPPRTTLSIGAPQYGTNPTFVSGTTPLALSAVDDLAAAGDAAGLGVAATYVAVDSAAFSAYAATFTLSGQGAHAVQFYSVDRVGNAEPVRAAQVFADVTPPQTQLLVDGSASANATMTVASTDTLSLSAADAGSGVAATALSLDGAPAQPYAGPFTLSVGTHTLQFSSRDNVGNAEAPRSVFATVRSTDTTPPSLSLSLAAASTVTTTTPLLSASYADAGTGVDPASVRVFLDGADVTAGAEVAASSATFLPPAPLAQGAHTFAATVADRAGNVSSATAQFFVDSLPPVTTLIVGAPQFASTALFVATTTPLGFAVSKPALTYYSVDGGSFTVFSASFTLAAEGPRLLRYYSVDAAGVAEAVRASTVTLDETPPATRLLVDGSAATGGSLVLSTTDTLSLAASDAGAGVQATLYALDGATLQAYAAVFSLSSGTHTVSFESRDNVGNLEALHSVAAAVRAPVTTPPSLSLSPADGSLVTATTATIIAVYAAAPGAAVAVVHLSLDRVDVTTQAAVTASSATFRPGALAQGAHVVSATVSDDYGNVASATATFTLDSIAPVTTLLVDGVAVSSPAIAAMVSDTFTLSAADAGTGVARTLYALDGGAEAFYSTGFSLTPGAHMILFQSADVAGNVEAAKVVSVSVGAPLTPPTVAILSPSGSGFSAEVEGAVTVIGSVAGPALSSWKLEAAGGANASFGFAMISSGSISVSAGALGTWDARALRGWQTLRLSALNAAGGAASVTEAVYVGDPSLALEITGLKLPMGVAVGANGLVYVADTGNDRVQVFTAQGKLLSSFGSSGDHDDRGRQAIALSKPEALAVDRFGNLYVADTGDKRVLKLSSLGTVLQQVAVPGKPDGVAVDNGGSLYVSDSDNGQVVKYNQLGSRQQAFLLPGGKPAGLALDSLGRLYVADPKKKRIVVFSSTGAVLASWDRAGFQRPFGVAVDSAGASVAVSDMARDQFLKFDALGEPQLAYGGRESGLGAPRGLAFDAAGMLYVAERTKNRVIKVGPPAPGMPPVPIAQKLELLGEDNAFITNALGGKLERKDHAALIVPPGALSDDMDLTLSTPAVRLAAEEALKARKLDGDGLISVSTGVAFGPDGTKLQAPAYVVVPYDPRAVNALGVPELSLKLYWWNPDRQDWQWAPGRVDPATHTLSGRGIRLAHYKVVVRKDGK